MNINLFLQALNPSELKELERKLLNYKEERITTKEFISKNEMSGRLLNVLSENSEPGEVFQFVDQINRSKFLRLRKAGERTWHELDLILNKVNR